MPAVACVAAPFDDHIAPQRGLSFTTALRHERALEWGWFQAFSHQGTVGVALRWCYLGPVFQSRVACPINIQGVSDRDEE